jgi:hypothetical protein
MLKIIKKGQALLMVRNIQKFQTQAFTTIGDVFDSRSAPVPR